MAEGGFGGVQAAQADEPKAALQRAISRILFVVLNSE
jgi:hypothetical protein